MWRVVVAVIVVAVMVFSCVDVVTISPSRVRFVPKAVWAIAVLLLSVLGSLLWWTIGRAPRGSVASTGRSALGPEDDPSFITDIELRKANREQADRIRDLERQLSELDDDEQKPDS